LLSSPRDTFFRDQSDPEGRRYRTKEDLDSEEALKLLTSNDTDALGLSLGKKQVFEAALRKLKLTEVTESTTDESIPVTTKSLAKDGSLEEILNKIEGTSSLEDSLLALGTTNLSRSGKSQATLNSSTLSQLDNDPQVFLGHQQKAGIKQGEKPLLIPNFVNLGTYDNSKEEQEIGNSGSGATISRLFSVRQKENQNWNKLPCQCRLPQTHELCTSS